MATERLQGKKALVTGGGVGIGKSIALAFAREGADVAIASRNTANLEGVAAKIREMGRTALAITADIAEEDEVKAMVDKTMSEFGRIDVLVNNSGIPGQFLDVSEMDLSDWNQVLTVNITGTMLCSREALRDMRARKSGNIINISSMAGKRVTPKRSSYVSSKFAMHGFTLTLAQEVGPDNIRVNCICPGATEGDRIERVINAFVESSGRSYEEVRKRLESRASLRRMVTPEEVAECAVFFASEESSGMTGADSGCFGGDVRGEGDLALSPEGWQIAYWLHN